jgi:hypothetical protein
MGLTQRLGTIPLAIFTDASNNIGIGGSPSGSYKFEVTGNIRGTGTAYDFYTSSGLGTSAASGLLRVITAGTSTGIAVGQANSSRYTAIQPNEHIIYNDDFFMRTNGAFPLSLGTNNTIRMTITSTGLVRINTTSTLGGGILGLNGNLEFGGTAGGNYRITNYQAGFLAFDTDNTERMRITSGGQVQIKQGADTGSDGIRLINISAGNRWTIVNGGDNFLYLVYNEVSKGNFNFSSGVYTPLSDKNKKKDFEESNIGLNEILGLKPTLYRIEDEEILADKHLGLIAQEVKEFIPQAYVESINGENTFIGLDYQAITCALVKAIQELSAKVSALENKS